jgi:hypothetical protein
MLLLTFPAPAIAHSCELPGRREHNAPTSVLRSAESADRHPWS